MPNGLETQALGVDPSVDPVILAVMFIAFLIGAVGPFALCVLGSIREERAMRRHAALACGDRSTSATVANGPDRSALPPAAKVETLAPSVPHTAANDEAQPATAAARG